MRQRRSSGRPLFGRLKDTLTTVVKGNKVSVAEEADDEGVLGGLDYFQGSDHPMRGTMRTNIVSVL